MTSGFEAEVYWIMFTKINYHNIICCAGTQLSEQKHLLDLIYVVNIVANSLKGVFVFMVVDIIASNFAYFHVSGLIEILEINERFLVYCSQ